MKIDEHMTAEFVIERMVRRYATCTELASEARAMAMVESDSNRKNIWEEHAVFHEMRADVIFDILRVVAGSEELAADWVNEE